MLGRAVEKNYRIFAVISFGHCVLAFADRYVGTIGNRVLLGFLPLVMVFPFFILMLTLLALPLWLIVGTALFSVGRDPFLKGLFIEVSAESAPSGDCTIYSIPYRDVDEACVQ